MINEINNQYIGLIDDLILSKSKNALNLLIDNRSQAGSVAILEIDEITMYLLTEITGTETVNQFIIRFCREYNLNYMIDYSWIFSNLMEMKANLMVDFYHCEQNCKLMILGDDNSIRPISATIEVTNKCNLNCQHCYIDGDITNQDTMGLEHFKQLVTTLQANNIINVELTGGEFFTHSDAIQILELCLQSFSIVGLLTNGVYIPDPAIDLITKYKGKIIVNVSVDSTIPQIHDQFRGVEGSHARTLENLKKLTNNGIYVRVSSVLFKENMLELDYLVDLAKEYNASMFTYSFIEKVGRGKSFSAIEFDSQDAYEEYMGYINDVTLKNKDYIPVIEREDHSGKSYCGAGVRSMVIDGHGDIRPCVLFPKSKLFGNVINESYPDIFEKEIFQQMINLKAPSIEHGCNSDCPSLKYCQGCIFHAFNFSASYNPPCKWVEVNGYQPLNEILKPIFNKEMEIK